MQTLVVALGAGLGIWGVINLLEGYGNNTPGANGAAPKDVQELLGHSDVSTAMNVYAHATREAKRSSARLSDKVIGGE